MITSLSVTAKARTSVDWWRRVFPTAQSWKFTPGINVLWGPNGSGKSTILLLLARLHHCVQTGRTFVTQASLRDLGAGRLEVKKPTGIKVHHDGQEVRYFSPERVVGRDQYGEVDWDCGGEAAFGSFLVKGSTGQLNRHRLVKILEPKREKVIPWHPTAASFLKEGQHVTDWHSIAKWVDLYLKGTVKKPGMVTMLLDEPDAGLDWPHKQEVWEFLTSTSDRCQWIIASHSIYAMRLPGAHYLELQPEYLDKCRASVRDLLKGDKASG